MKKQKEWLFVQYKREHPEAVPKKNRSKKNIFIVGKKILMGISLFLLINILAIALACAVNRNVLDMVVQLSGGIL